MRLKDKVAIITGAGGGIGRASAIKFAQEGAHVVAVDMHRERNQETVQLVRGESGLATAVEADVTDPQDVRRMIDTAVQEYGRLDILWNHAGIGMSGGILDVNEEQFDRVFRVNVKSVFLGCKEAIPVMKSQGGGVILNTGSINSLVGRYGNAIYPATKGAVLQMTRCLALDHAADGIRVNCICPGPIDTDNAHGIMERSGDPEAWLRERLENIPMGRMGTTQELANVAAFLCSDEASFITGAAIVADGGWTAQ